MWNKINSSNSYLGCYQLDMEPEVIHIIKFGHEDEFCVLHDDAYDLTSGETEIMTRLEIFDKYGITL